MGPPERRNLRTFITLSSTTRPRRWWRSNGVPRSLSRRIRLCNRRVLHKDVPGRFDAHRLSHAFFFWPERAHFKIGEDRRREGPHVSGYPLEAPVVGFKGFLQFGWKLWIFHIVVSLYRVVGWSAKDTEHSARTDLPNSERHRAFING